MLSGGFHIFSFKGIPFKAHWTLIAFMLFRVFRNPEPEAFKFNLAIALIFLVSVIVHELGHALTARKIGGKAHEIVLWPLGGLAYTSGHGSLQNSLKVTLGGPLTHIPLAIAFAIPAVAVEGSFSWTMFSPFFDQVPATSFWSHILMVGVKVQVILLLFNLCVPAYPLDGGHLIVETLLIRGKSADFTAKVIVALSAVVGVVLLAYFEMLFIGAFILYSTWQLHNLRIKGQLQQHPLFHKALALSRSSKKARPKFLSLVKKKEKSSKSRHCPGCMKEVPKKAIMCGFCEKELPN